MGIKMAHFGLEMESKAFSYIFAIETNNNEIDSESVDTL